MSTIDQQGEESAADDAVSSNGPDYHLEETVPADTPEALRAITDATRLAILDLLLERAATTSQLGEALGRPRGTIGYHLKVLKQCGLVRVVRTERVRALTAKYYGRVGRTILISGAPGMKDPLFIIHDALRDIEMTDGERPSLLTARRARIPESRAAEYAKRLADLAVEFAAEPRDGERVYGLIAGVFPTTLASFRGDGDA